ncbi:MAG: gamma-glutamylcyclotransferase [Bifidobacteriaceae bacterium]|jgi:AGZA family xanthine/uracil permease-like MFS transporter|nr:gamma-glutamylcyclotransferase [Bifidobacteriaceae bacterium]
MTATTAAPSKPGKAAKPYKWWVHGDWNGLFGLGTNVLLNVIVLTGLCLTVVHIPSATVYGRILPALGIALPLGNIWYTFLARSLSKRENRSDVTALPYGPSVPHTFIVVGVVMLPVYLESHDPMKAWRSGLAWCMLIGVIVLIGAVIGPWVRKWLPRAALLGSLAGISITFIAMRPVSQMWQAPWIALCAFAFILVGWMANRKMPFNAPVGLIAVIVATVVAWVAVLLKWSDVLTTSAVSDAVGNLALHAPIPGGEVIKGLTDIAPLLSTAIPLGIYNFTEGMTNIESAAAAGDRYSMRQVLVADGLGAIVGSFLGSPFPPAVYIGHPGWKKAGGRLGYSLVTGIVIFVICVTGLVSMFLAIFPMAALVPVLLYIGLVIGGQATQVSGVRYAPAIILALIPNIAQWASGQVDDALSAAGTTAKAVGYSAMGTAGCIYDGMTLLGEGAVLVGIILGAIACFAIDKRMYAAAVTSWIGAVLSFFGIINAWKIGINASPGVTLGYLFLGLILAGFGWWGRHEKDKGLDDNLLFVNGTLMRGLPLHDHMEDAELLARIKTAAKYRLRAVGGDHPAMYEAAATGEAGVAVAGELYQLNTEVLLRVIEGEPAGLKRGPVALEDGRVVPGIVAADPEAVAAEEDISEFGGWREYLAGRPGGGGAADAA